jgi:signal transduction histidine kinase
LVIEGWRRLAKSGQFDNAEARLAELGAISQQALREIRLLVYELRPLALAQDGLVTALQQRLNAVEKPSGIEAHLLADQLLHLPPMVETELYRIAQAVLNTHLKAAFARQVTLRIVKNAQAVLFEVTADALNMDLNHPVDQPSHDLTAICTRAEKLGGTVTLSAVPGQGTTLKVCLPLSIRHEPQPNARQVISPVYLS